MNFKKLVLSAFVLGLAFSAEAQIKDSLSYALGVVKGNEIKNSPASLQFQQDAFDKGFKDAYAGKAQMSAADAQAYVNKKNSELVMLKEKQYFADNAKKPGIITTASGLQYEVLSAGTGPKPTLQQTVVAHYHGTLLDGSVFDSSVNRGEPATFPVARLIPGWVEALQLMPKGSKWRLYIPSNLGYGPRGAGASIPPNAILIFELELIVIK